MKKTKELHELQAGRLLRMAVCTIGLVLSLSLFGGHFSIVSHAESAGKITASGGAKVRSSASASASTLTSYPKDTVISIRSQIKASDGYTWYEVWVTADSLGYIRSDLVEITDGTTPPTSTEVSPSTPSPTNDNQSPAEVTAVNPISATVTGGGSGGVRIRSNASTNSRIVTTVNNDLALTVTGQANSLDRDNKVWYEVNFYSNGAEITGFIRSDFVRLSGDLTPYTPPEDTEPEPGIDDGPTEPEQNTPELKAYDTLNQNGVWYLLTPEDPIHGYDIEDLLKKLNEYPELYEKSQKDVKSQKVVIVLLVFLLVAAAGGVGFLIFKIRDMMDSAYFNQVENETIRRRSEQRGQGGRTMPSVGSDRKGVAQGQRPSGAPQGQRPSGAPQGQRPSGAPQGQRPSGAPQGQRPAGAPQGQRPSGAPQGQRPSGAPQGQKPAGAPQGQRPAGASQGQSTSSQKPKNFMSEDDEFEFEFLNYEGEDEK